MSGVKRIVLWALSTLSTVAVLFGYHTSTSSVMATGNDPAFSSSLPGRATPGSTGTAASTITGDVAQTRYGPVQVQLAVSGSRITTVSVLQYPDQGGRDLQISNSSLPRLVQDTLDSQGDSVDMVSGATYTSEGYLESLQSALDQAGL